MMSYFFLIISFLLLAFSRQLFIRLLFQIAGAQLGQRLYFLLLFPGVILHELSHFFTASLLFVPTGKISFFPEKEKMGSVQVAKTDVVRQAIIGFAPTLFGTAAILSIFFFLFKLPPKVISLNQLLALFKDFKNLPFLYLIFAIANTLFTSHEDRRSFFGFFLFLLLIAIILYLFSLLSAALNLFLQSTNLAAGFLSAAYFSTFLVNLVFTVPLFILKKIIKSSQK